MEKRKLDLAACFHNHDFWQIGDTPLGKGQSPAYKVQCRICHLTAVRKDVSLSEVLGSLRDPNAYLEAGQRLHLMKEEVHLLKTLKHPHILQYLDAELQSQGKPELRIYTDYCDKRDLSAYIEDSSLESEPAPPHELDESCIFQLYHGIFSALAYCHHGLVYGPSEEDGGHYSYQGFLKGHIPIIHRDIKPANIFLKSSPQPTSISSPDGPKPQESATPLLPVLGDFGLAYRQANTKFSTEEMWAGTIPYMPPEVRNLTPGPSRASDIWSAGLTILHFLTSSFWDALQVSRKTSVQSRLNAIKTIKAPLLEKTPEGLLIVLAQCLDPSPTSRPSALEVLSICLKCDDSDEGIERSESFWRTLLSWQPEKEEQQQKTSERKLDAVVGSKKTKATTGGELGLCVPMNARAPVGTGSTGTETNEDIVAKVVRGFAAQVSRLKTSFSPVEACLVLPRIHKHCKPRFRFACQHISSRISGLSGSTVFHAAALTASDALIRDTLLDEFSWLFDEHIGQLSTVVDLAGLLPSTLAASRQDLEIAKILIRVEEGQRQRQCQRDIQKAVSDERLDENTRIEWQVDFLFMLLTSGGTNIPPLKDETARNVAFVAADRGFLPIIRKLLAMDIPATITNVAGENMMHSAARGGYTDVIRFLASEPHKLPVDARDLDGRSVLHHAAQNGHAGTVAALLGMGAEADAADGAGRTPLYWAARAGHVGVVKALLERKVVGGGRMAATLERESPLAVARRRGHAEVVRLLEQS